MKAGYIQSETFGLCMCEHGTPGVSTAQVFSQRTDEKVFDVKGNQ